MPKRLSENEKKEILNSFTEGLTVDQLTEKYKFTKLTISRNLKKSLGDLKYREIYKRNKKERDISNKQNKDINNSIKKKSPSGNQRSIENKHVIEKENFINGNQFKEVEFFEIAPLNFDIDNAKQKDLSSVPLKTVNLPNIVYMIVEKSIELEIKLLNEYPSWQFLPPEDLNRKTIEIFQNIKVANRNCNKNQKVIKVPNSKIFQIVAPILKSRGISRIVSEDLLISL